MPIFNHKGIPQWIVVRHITAIYITQLSSIPMYLPNLYILFAREHKSKFLNMELKGS